MTARKKSKPITAMVKGVRVPLYGPDIYKHNIVDVLKARLLHWNAPHNANDNVSRLFEPRIAEDYNRGMPSEEKQLQAELERRVQSVLECLLIDTQNDPNTQNTAKRIAKMFLHEVFVGRYKPVPAATEFPNTRNLDEMLVYGPIHVKSTCSHHFQPFIGSAWIGLVPDTKLLGLSKYNRIVSHFARRPQIQEELTVQIADYIDEILKPKGLMVVIKSTHFCVHCRGVEQSSEASTSVTRGVLRSNQSSKAEFFNLIRLKTE